MAELFSRSFAGDLEIRSDGTGRTIGGILVPWDQVATVSDGGRPYKEAFRRGAFDHVNAGSVKLLSQHNRRSNPLGRATLLRSDAAGQYGEFKVSKTVAGDEVLELVRDGALDSFSVGFDPDQQVQQKGVTYRTRAGLHEVSVVTFPAYAGAKVTTLRSTEGLTRLDPEDIERLRALLGA